MWQWDQCESVTTSWPQSALPALASAQWYLFLLVKHSIEFAIWKNKSSDDYDKWFLIKGFRCGSFWMFLCVWQKTMKAIWLLWTQTYNWVCIYGALMNCNYFTWNTLETIQQKLSVVDNICWFTHKHLWIYDPPHRQYWHSILYLLENHGMTILI